MVKDPRHHRGGGRHNPAQDARESASKPASQGEEAQVLRRTKGVPRKGGLNIGQHQGLNM